MAQIFKIFNFYFFLTCDKNWIRQSTHNSLTEGRIGTEKFSSYLQLQ